MTQYNIPTLGTHLTTEASNNDILTTVSASSIRLFKFFKIFQDLFKIFSRLFQSLQSEEFRDHLEKSIEFRTISNSHVKFQLSSEQYQT